MAAEQEAEETVSQELHSPSELKIVLLGEAGVGKSEAGNTILGREEFRSGLRFFTTVTRECEKRTGEVSGRRVTVVDTPDLFHTDRVEIERCVSLSAPGPHAFLLLIRVHSKEMIDTRRESIVERYCESFDKVQELFGERAVRNTMILFTCRDYLRGRTIEQHIEELGEEFQKLVEKCGNRYHVLNTEDRSDRTQVTQLLDKIDNMVKGSGGCYLPNEIYQEVEERIRLKEQELNEKHKEELRRREEEMKQKYEEEQRRREEMKQKYEEEQRRREEEMKQKYEEEQRRREDELMEKLRKQMKEEELEKEAEESKLPVRRRNSIDEGFRPNMSGGEGEAPLADAQAPPSPPELRMVLLGKTGAGKSAAGNTILGREEFRSEASSSAVTRECEKRKGQVAGRRVAVINTPELSQDKLQIRRSISLSALGPHSKSYYTSEGKERAGEVRIGKKRDEQIDRVGYEKSKLLKERSGELELQLDLRREREKSRVLERELKRAQEGKQEVKKESEKMSELEVELERRRERERSRVLEQELKRVQEVEQEMKKEREKRRELDKELRRERQDIEKGELKREKEGSKRKQTFSVSGGEGEAPLADTQAPPSPPELRMVLLGKTGAGKSAAGNTILGREEFRSEASSSAVTRECEKIKGQVAGRRVAVINTPELSQDKLQIRSCVSLSAPGPHAFLLVIPVGRFTEEERRAVETVQEIFSEEAVRRYMMLLFTHSDKLKGKTIEDYIQTGSKELQQLVEKCGNRYHVLNTEDKSDRTQVTQLLDKIDNMVKGNNGSYYTSEMYQQAEERAGDVRIGKKRDEQIDRVGYEKSKLLKERPGELELQLELRRERERSRVLERDLKRAQEVEQELKKEREKRRELEEEQSREREKRSELEEEQRREREKRSELEEEQRRERQKRSELEEEQRRERQKRSELEEEQRRERQKRSELEEEQKRERQKRSELEEEQECRRVKSRVLEWERKEREKAELKREKGNKQRIVKF